MYDHRCLFGKIRTKLAVQNLPQPETPSSLTHASSHHLQILEPTAICSSTRLQSLLCEGKPGKQEDVVVIVFHYSDVYNTSA